MKKLFLSMALLAAGASFGQTLFVPSGTSGIGSSTVAGNVGIGTNTPTGKLDVRLGGWGNIPRVIFREINANPTMLFYRPTGSGTTAYPWSVSTNDLAEMEFKTGAFANIGSEVLTTKFALGLNNSYFNTNLGIGTNAPKDKLHLVDNNPTIRLSSSSYFGASGNGVNSILGTIKFSNRDDNHIYRSEIRGILTGGWAEHVGLSFTTYGNGNQQERMRISHDGNVGIGTSSPTEKLQILNGNISLYSSDYSALNNNRGIIFWDWLHRGISQVQYPSSTSWGGRVIRFSNSLNDNFGNDNGGFDFTDHTGTSVLRIKDYKVGIGMDTENFPVLVGGTANVSNYKLFVKGGILSEEVRVALKTTWADYVFAPSYQLKTIDEVATFIKDNGHLPNVPSAKQVEADGINVAEMAKIQMEKIEELTLYVIELKKEIDALKAKK